jgi:hypothetical protein
MFCMSRTQATGLYETDIEGDCSLICPGFVSGSDLVSKSNAHDAFGGANPLHIKKTSDH